MLNLYLNAPKIFSFVQYFFSWYAATDALAKLHSVDYKAIGLTGYGKSSGFYSRQIRSLVKVSTIQAAVKDENGKEVGPLPRLDDMVKWFKKNEIDDETTIVHGDFKVDIIFLFFNKYINNNLLLMFIFS